MNLEMLNSKGLLEVLAEMKRFKGLSSKSIYKIGNSWKEKLDLNNENATTTKQLWQESTLTFIYVGVLLTPDAS